MVILLNLLNLGYLPEVALVSVSPRRLAPAELQIRLGREICLWREGRQWTGL